MSHQLTTERLTLRPFLPKDAGPVMRLIGNLNVSRWLTHVPHPYALADANWFIEKEQNVPGVTYAVELKSNLIGAVSHGPMLGYWIAEEQWGNGYASEAAHRLISHRIENGAKEIDSGYHLGNAGSCNVLTKLGFVPTVQETVHSRPLKCDVILQHMRLTLANWQARP